MHGHVNVKKIQIYRRSIMYLVNVERFPGPIL